MIVKRKDTRKKKNQVGYPPLLRSTTQRRGNPVPPNQADQTPDPGQVLGSLKCDPFFAHLELLEGRLRDFLPFFPRPPSRRVTAGGLLLCSGSSVSKDLGVEFRKNLRYGAKNCSKGPSCISVRTALDSFRYKRAVFWACHRPRSITRSRFPCWQNHHVAPPLRRE